MKLYFACALTEDGFVNGYGELFSPDKLDSLFILKGASGVGKSTLMRKLAAAAERNGLPVDYILCSSDPTSLDGVIIGSKVAVIDGTAPHTVDPVCPGAFDSIINLGDFWDEKLLIPERERLLSLGTEKKTHYDKAYALLAMHKKLRLMREELCLPAIDEAKTARKLRKVFRNSVTNPVSGSLILRRTRSMLCVLPEPSCTTVVRVKGKCEEKDIVMRRILQFVNENGYEGEYSECVPDAENIAYIRVGDTLFTRSDGDGITLNAGDLFDRKMLRTTRVKRKCLTSMIDDTLSRAKDALLLATAAHKMTEKIYIPAMDFAALDGKTRELAAKIISLAYN